MVAGIRVVVARADDPPFSVDAEVLEEDTWLTLSTPAETISAPGHPVRVMTRVWEARPEEPGCVIVKDGSPLRLLAVVHDMNAEPSWHEAGVRSALAQVFAEASSRGLRTLRLPLLATTYGHLAPRRFIELLREEIEKAPRETSLRAVWLVRGDECGTELLAALTAVAPSDG